MNAIQKTIMVSFGFLCTGIAISLFLLVGFGPDSISVFSAGLANTFGTSVGIANLSFYFVIIIVTFFVDRHYLSVATFLSLIIVGPSIDFFMPIFSMVVTTESFIGVRLIFFFIAFISLAFGVALYLSADFGISAAEMIPVVISDKSGLQFRWCKVGFDVTVVIIGIFLGGAFGLGTIFVALTTGPAIQYFRKNLEKRRNIKEAI